MGLKYRDPITGEYVRYNFPLIKGEKGEPGTGIHVGEEAPTDSNVALWFDPSDHSGSNCVTKDLVEDDPYGHGIHINSSGKSNVDITYQTFNNTGYAVLLNENAVNGKNIRVSDCTIYSEKADAIEFNNPHPLDGTSEVYRNGLITNNFIETGVKATTSTSGFAIGIAQTNNVIVGHNVTDTSRNEGLHIEDTQKNIIANANIFDGNLNDGCRVLAHTRGEQSAQPIIITSNVFEQKDSKKSGIGFHRVYDSRGSIDECIFSNNRVIGFKTGMSLLGHTSVYAGGTLIQNCELGFTTNGAVKGCLTIHSCDVGCRLSPGAFVENVHFTGTHFTDCSQVFQFNKNSTNPARIIRLNNFDFNLKIQDSNAYPKFAIMNDITACHGVFTITTVVNNNETLTEMIQVSYNGTDLTKTLTLRKAYGAIASDTNLSMEDGKLVYDLYNATRGTMLVKVSFSGVYIV